MKECSMCSSSGVVDLDGRVELGGHQDVFDSLLCVDHYNMVKRHGRKWCPNCTENSPVEMDFDSLIGDREHWYCSRCNTEFEYKRTDR